MPRYTFGTATLKGASGGLGALAQAIAKGGHTEQDAYDKELMTQSRIGQAIAQMQAAQAAGRAHDAQAAAHTAKTDVLNRRPDLFREQVANQSGVDMPTVDAYRATLRGESPMVPMGPPTEGGDMGVGAAKFGPETTSKLSGAIKQFLPLLSNMEDLKPDDLAQADQIYRTGRLSDDIIAGKLDRNAVGGAQAAASGKDLYKTDTTGAVLDQFGGGLETANPMAQSTIGLRGAQAGQANAAASEHYAGAGEKKARTDQIKAETDRGGKTGNIQIVTDANGNVTLVDKGTGLARPAVGSDGKPVQGKGGSLNGEQANALTFASRMDAADKILESMAGKGVTMPGWTKRTVQGTLELVPFIGDKLAEGPGAAMTNWTQSPEQQQVEQAQRDFINAVLRRESGAAISMPEFQNAAKQYFPQPGDKPAMIKQKAEARRRVINGMLAAVPQSMRNIPDASSSFSPGGNQPGTPRNVNVDY